MYCWLKWHINCNRDALIIPLADAFTSIYSGFVIFSVLGYMAEIRNVSVSEVAEQGEFFNVIIMCKFVIIGCKAFDLLKKLTKIYHFTNLYALVHLLKL